MKSSNNEGDEIPLVISVARNHLFILDAQNQNNYIETVLIRSLIDPLPLASY